MALDAASSRLFVVCRKPACVLTYDTKTGKLITSIPCVGDSDDVFWDAASLRLYVIGGEGFVDVFGTKAESGELSLLARIPTSPKARTGLLIPKLRTLAVVAPETAVNPAKIILFSVLP